MKRIVAPLAICLMLGLIVPYPQKFKDRLRQVLS
jgi:hypothetical protein